MLFSSLGFDEGVLSTNGFYVYGDKEGIVSVPNLDMDLPMPTYLIEFLSNNPEETMFNDWPVLKDRKAVHKLGSFKASAGGLSDGYTFNRDEI